MIMETKTYNPHKWFFAYVNNLEGYNKDYAKVIREGIILEYTCGLTGSLSALYAEYPTTYQKMKKDLLHEHLDEMNSARKRLIAVLFSFLKDYKPTMAYVKQAACHAAKTKFFNGIPLNELKRLYRIFGTKNIKEVKEFAPELIWPALRKENMN